MKVKKTALFKLFEATCESVGFPLHPPSLGKTSFLPSEDQICAAVGSYFDKIMYLPFGPRVVRRIHILPDDEVEIQISAEIDAVRPKVATERLLQEMMEQEFQITPLWAKIGFVPCGTKDGKTMFTKTGTKMIQFLAEPANNQLLCDVFEVELVIRVSYTEDRLPSPECTVVPSGYDVVCHPKSY